MSTTMTTTLPPAPAPNRRTDSHHSQSGQNSTKRPHNPSHDSSYNKPDSSTDIHHGEPQKDDPERANKRVRVDEFAKARSAVRAQNERGELGKGGRWVLDQVDLMERQYKEVLMAATALVKYQTYALQTWRRHKYPIPLRLQRRLNLAYGAYQATQRQTQAYMIDAAQHAATPSHPVLVPPPSAPSVTLAPTSFTPQQPLASPVPLSATSILSYPPPPPPVSVIVSQQQQVPLPMPEQGSVPSQSVGVAGFTADPNTQISFQPQQVSTNNTGNDGQIGMGQSGTMEQTNMQGMDLSGINMEDINALMASGNFDFSSFNSGSVAGHQSTEAQNIQNFQNQSVPQSAVMSNDQPPTQSQMDTLFPSLNTNTGQANASQINDSDPPAFDFSNFPQTTETVPNIAAGTAQSGSAGAGMDNAQQAQQQLQQPADQADFGDGNDFTFDFSTGLEGELDLSELVGLFGDDNADMGGIGDLDSTGMGIGIPDTQSQAQIGTGVGMAPQVNLDNDTSKNDLRSQAPQEEIEESMLGLTTRPSSPVNTLPAPAPAIGGGGGAMEMPLSKAIEIASKQMGNQKTQVQSSSGGVDGNSQQPDSGADKTNNNNDNGNIIDVSQNDNPDANAEGEADHIEGIDFDDFDFGGNSLGMAADEFDSLMADFK